MLRLALLQCSLVSMCGHASAVLLNLTPSTSTEAEQQRRRRQSRRRPARRGDSDGSLFAQLEQAAAMSALESEQQGIIITIANR